MLRIVRYSFVRYVMVMAPAAGFVLAAVLINSHQLDTARAQRLAENARLAAANVDLTFSKLIELTSFCATSPELTEQIDLPRVRASCGRYATRLDAWVVIVETGKTHRQILNTRADAPAMLPTYPREDEDAALRELEERSLQSGEPGIADVFTGLVLPQEIVSAGQYLRLANGHDAMLYVSTPAHALSDQLARLASDEKKILALVDRSRRVVARSHEPERAMFATPPTWFIDLMKIGRPGAVLGVPGPEFIGGRWDAGYHPLTAAPGWMAVAVEPVPISARLWSPFSLPTAVSFVGLLISALLLWMMLYRDRATRLVEAARQAKAESERKSLEKSRILAAIAHDIRSPLVSLIGSLEMIKEKERHTSGPLHTAHSSAETLLQLVDDVLELSFLGSGNLIFHPSPVDLRQLASVLMDQTRQLAVQKGLRFRLDLDPRLPAAVEVDRLRLQQVLTNLLTNAVKYTENGAITLRIRQEAAGEKSITLDFAVIDTGIGLAPQDIPRILREFGRLERDAERREQGAGLGLAIVQQILNGMNSSLAVNSALGLGSTFSFRLTLPFVIQEEIGRAARPLLDVEIFYVEDEPSIRRITTRRLEEAGAKVVSAVDGEDALRKLRGVTPNLLLIDLQLPGLDGVQVIRCLKEIAPDHSYPIFVLTSHVSGPVAAEARAAGADSIFTKPVQVAALAAAFRARHGNSGNSSPQKDMVTVPAREPLLHVEVFREVIELVDVTEFVADFETEIQQDISALQNSLIGLKGVETRKLAHRALGRCLVIGAAALARQLERIEQASSEEKLALAGELLNGLQELLAATLSEMRQVMRAKEALRTCI